MSRILPAVGLVLAGLAFWFAGQDSSALAIFSGMGALVAIGLGLLAVHPLLCVTFSSLAGVGVGLYLTGQHHAALSGAESFCNINQVLNCDVVNTSAWSEVFGIPTALYGAALYLALAVVSFSGWQRREEVTSVPGVTILVGGAANVASVALAAYSVQLGAFCLFCVSLYLVAVLVLVGGVFAARADGWSVGEALKSRDFSVLVAVGAVGLIGGTWMYQGQDSAAEAAMDTSSGGGPDWAALYEQPDGPIEISPHAPTWGKPDAPITVVEYADYECPHCALMAKEIKVVLARHPQARLQHRHYPLSSECNPSMTEAMHLNACGAARAAICAQEQGRFWELNALMFRNQTHLDPDDVAFMASQVGLDVEALEECMASETARQRLAADVADANAARIHSTPTLFVHGLHPDGWIKLKMGHEALDLLLDAQARGVVLPPRPPPTQPTH